MTGIVDLQGNRKTVMVADAKPGMRGGAREGAGRKPKSDGSAGDPYFLLARAKAKHETYRAGLAEMEYKKRAGELIERSDVESVASRLHAFLAQSLRTLPDDLERRAGITADQAEIVNQVIDSLTISIREMLNGDF